MSHVLYNDDYSITQWDQYDRKSNNWVSQTYDVYNDEPIPVILSWGSPTALGFFNDYTDGQIQNSIENFAKEFEKNAGKFKQINIEDLAVSFLKIINTLAEVNAYDINVQITSLNSVVIKAETAKGNIYTELFFNELTGWLDEAVVNIICNKQLQLNISGRPDTVILAIKQYFGIAETNYLTLLNNSVTYAIPEPAITAA